MPSRTPSLLVHPVTHSLTYTHPHQPSDWPPHIATYCYSQQSPHLQQQQASNANAGGQGLPKRISQGQGLASGLATGSAPGSAPGSGPGSAPGSARVPLHMKLDPRVLENLVRQLSTHISVLSCIIAHIPSNIPSYPLSLSLSPPPPPSCRQQSSHMQQQASIAQSVSILKMDGF